MERLAFAIPFCPFDRITCRQGRKRSRLDTQLDVIQMKIIRIAPTLVKSIGPNNQSAMDMLVVGECCPREVVYATLGFPMPCFGRSEALVKAVLKVHCSHFHVNRCMDIFINRYGSTNVCGVGTYEWDVTGLLNNAGSDLTMFVLKPQRSAKGSLLAFETKEADKTPELLLFVENDPTPCDHQGITVRKNYSVVNYPQTSEWIECFCYDRYYYFIRDMGRGDIQVCVEISPDKRLIYADSEPFTILAGETGYVEPNRVSRFVRLKFWNKSKGGINSMDTVFQAKK